MLWYIVIPLGLILLFVLLLFFNRSRQSYKIDALEKKKIDLMNEPVFEALTQVKLLNFTGETEKHYEVWKNKWESIVNNQLPNLELLIFDAEQSVEKYRFTRADKIREKVDEELTKIEQEMTTITSEIEQFIHVEKENKLQVKFLKEKFAELKKHLVLHQYEYGTSYEKLEEEIDGSAFDLAVIAQEEQQGNYLKAEQLLLQLKNHSDALFEKLKVIPRLVTECNAKIPRTLHDLNLAHQEMEGNGFPLKHVNFIAEMDHLKQKLDQAKSLLDVADSVKAEEKINEINIGIDHLCDLLETEGLSRQYYVIKKKQLDKRLKDCNYKLTELVKETNEVLQSYHLSGEEIITVETMGKDFSKIYGRWHDLSKLSSENQTPFSYLQTESDAISDEVDDLLSRHLKFQSKLNGLRTDELASIDKAGKLQTSLKEIARKIKLANLPGIPEKYQQSLDESQSLLDMIQNMLSEKPLNIEKITSQIENAESLVIKCEIDGQAMIDDMRMTEKVIQYGNRYRLSHPQLAAELKEAEQLFRKFQYKAALEQASTSVEKVEPGFFRIFEKQTEKRENQSETEEIESQNTAETIAEPNVDFHDSKQKIFDQEGILKKLQTEAVQSTYVHTTKSEVNIVDTSEFVVSSDNGIVAEEKANLSPHIITNQQVKLEIPKDGELTFNEFFTSVEKEYSQNQLLANEENPSSDTEQLIDDKSQLATIQQPTENVQQTIFDLPLDMNENTNSQAAEKTKADSSSFDSDEARLVETFLKENQKV